MAHKVDMALYDEAHRAESLATVTAEDAHKAAIRLSKYVSDLVADGRLHDPSTLQWLREYVDAFNEAWTASQDALSRWQSLAKQLLGE